MPTMIYSHLIWATFDRRPMITSEIAKFLGEYLPATALRFGVRVLAIGMVCDHLHLALEMPPTIDVPKLVQAFKGSSARVVNRDVAHAGLRWAKGYDFRSVSPGQLGTLIDYVANQERRHPDKLLRRVAP